MLKMFFPAWRLRKGSFSPIFDLWWKGQGLYAQEGFVRFQPVSLGMICKISQGYDIPKL